MDLSPYMTALMNLFQRFYYDLTNETQAQAGVRKVRMTIFFFCKRNFSVGISYLFTYLPREVDGRVVSEIIFLDKN